MSTGPAGLEVVLDEALALDLHDPVRREPAGEDVEDQLRRDARLRAEDERLADRGVGERDDDLVARLHDLPGAVRADVDDPRAERLEHGARTLERRPPRRRP